MTELPHFPLFARRRLLGCGAMQRFIILLGLCLTATGRGAEKWLEFGQAKVGETPNGFRSLVVGEGPLGEWKIVLDEVPSLLEPITGKAQVSQKRPVLAQLSRDRTDERFPILVYEEETFTDFTLTTKFKIVGGEVEQIAGVVFRFRDPRNFYYVRASAPSGTIYFFKVVEGERSAPIGRKIPVTAGVWHELTVECKGTQIRVLFNGAEAVPMLEDRSFISGQVGFWTKSDAVSYFGDTHLVYTRKENLATLLVRDAFKKYDRLRGLKIYAAPTNETQARIVASLDPAEIGAPAPKEEQDVFNRGTIYYGKGRNEVVVTLPLRDVNGEVAAAVRVVMNSFPGQTERNAIERARPVVKMMEPRVQRAADLFQ
jgi:hypothetical protein